MGLLYLLCKLEQRLVYVWHRSSCLWILRLNVLCDIDNIAFKLALSERARARVEDAGRVELKDIQATALARTKAVHLALLVLAILVPIFFGDGLILPFIAFLLGGIVESFVPGATVVETCQRIGKVMAAWLIGLVAFIGLVGAAET